MSHWYDMFTFYWPWAVLLVPVPLLIYLWLVKSRINERLPKIRFPGLERLNQAFGQPGNIQHQDKRQLVFLSLLWLLLVITLMRPQLVDQYKQVKNKGYDLMLAVDLSASMRALDFSTQTQLKSRLDVTKEVVSHFVKQRQGDRVGLVLFGEQAFLHVPLTLDTLSVSDMLNNTVAGMAGDSTAIGDALGLAVKNLRERPKGSRIIILLTDGEDTASIVPPLEAAKLAKQYGIKVYTIAVGRQNRVPYPDGRGGIIRADMKMDEALLQAIAKTTDAAYFKAVDKRALEKIYQQINQLEKSESEVTEHLIRKPLYRYPLGLFAFVLLAYLGVSTIRSRQNG